MIIALLNGAQNEPKGSFSRPQSRIALLSGAQNEPKGSFSRPQSRMALLSGAQNEPKGSFCIFDGEAHAAHAVFAEALDLHMIAESEYILNPVDPVVSDL